MATTRSGQTSNPTDAIGRFLRNAEANSQTLTSPDGKVLARQFLLSEQELTDATTYSIPDRHRIVSQLRLALADFYVHLERKKSIYGFDPVRALDLLGTSVESISDGEFHQGIVDLIAERGIGTSSSTGERPLVYPLSCRSRLSVAGRARMQSAWLPRLRPASNRSSFRSVRLLRTGTEFPSKGSCG